MEFSAEAFGDEFEKVAMAPHHKRVLKHLGGWAAPGVVIGAALPTAPDDKKTKDGVGRRLKNAVRGGLITSAYGGGLSTLMDSVHPAALGGGGKARDIKRTAEDAGAKLKGLANRAVAKFKAPKELKKIEKFDTPHSPDSVYLPGASREDNNHATDVANSAISKALANIQKPKKPKKRK